MYSKFIENNFILKDGNLSNWTMPGISVSNII